MRHSVKFAAGITLLALAAASQAAVIRSATSATASSTFGPCCDIDNTRDGSGLSPGFTSGVTDFDTYMAGNPLHTLAFNNNEWFSTSITRSATVTYDMGAVYSIDKMAFWNEDSNGVTSMDVFGSEDGVTFVQLLNDAVPTDHAIVDYPADIYSWGAQNLRHFRFELTCGWCAIGEVAFRTSDANQVPVPGTLALLGAAGIAGFGARRRRG